MLTVYASSLKRSFLCVLSCSVVSDCNPMDYSPPGSSVLGILQARTVEWVAISFVQGIFPTQGSNPGLLHCRHILYCLSHQGSRLKQAGS